MVKTGKWIAKHRILIVLIGILLLIPSVIGTIKTRINYDILSYLPESLETVKGQDVMVDEFGTGAFFSPMGVMVSGSSSTPQIGEVLEQPQ